MTYGLQSKTKDLNAVVVGHNYLLLFKNQYHGPIKLNKNVLQTERALKSQSAKGPRALTPPGLATGEVHLKIGFSPH